MKTIARFRWSCFALSLGLGASLLLLATFSTASAADDIDLTVNLSAPAHVAPGAGFVVNLTYANDGATASPEETWVTLTLPAGVEYVAATDQEGRPVPPDRIDGDQLAWNVGAIPSGECCQHIRIEERVDEALPEDQELTQTAVIESSTIDANPSNNTASVTSVVCDMAGSTKQVNAGEVAPGDVITYAITVERAQRPGEDTNTPRPVELIDTMSGGHALRFLGWDSPTSGTQNGQTLRWQGQVRAGEPLTLQYRVGVEDIIPPGEPLTNIAWLRWGERQLQLGPVNTTISLPENARMMNSEGGQWHHAQGVTLNVPPGAVTDVTRFEFNPLVEDAETIAGPPGWQFAHQAFELTAFRFGETIRNFEEPITLSIEYRESEVDEGEPQRLRLWYRQGPGEPWAMLGEPARVMSGTLDFETTHFTQFALFAAPRFQLHLPALVAMN